MKVFKSVLSVLVGYLVFALSAAALFPLSGHLPHRQASTAFMVGTFIYGVVFAFVGGFLAARLAPARPLAHAVAVATVLALGALVSLLSTVGHGAVWSQLGALFLMAPSAVAGGWAHSCQRPKT